MRTWIVPAGILLAVMGGAAGAAPVNYEELCQRARSLALQPYQALTNALPEGLRNLDYLQQNAIRFRDEYSLWRSERLPYEIQFFHPGFAHRHRVSIHELTEGRPRAIPFSTKHFDYGANRYELSPDSGFSGLRVNYTKQNFGEVAVFAGGSYFRMVGKGMFFGTSARGLAVDTVNLGNEEFPVFRDFWVQKPTKRDKELVIYALLDGPSIAGAYEFQIQPGTSTTAKIRSTLFPRREIKQLGIAPLTSMFFQDENRHAVVRDYRPEVHDSDGLQFLTSTNEWIWRPLDQGKMMRVNAYEDENPRGFGLIQRDRNFEHYQDLIGKFEIRPSVWVVPIGNWGKGAIELIQLPTDSEFVDNVVAFWKPAVAPPVGAPISFNYQLIWTKEHVLPETLGRIRAVRIGDVGGGEKPNLRFVIDYEGERMESLDQKEQIDAEVNFGNGTRLVADTVQRNNINDTWRLVIEFTRPEKAVDLRAVLKRQGLPVTETWYYTYQP